MKSNLSFIFLFKGLLTKIPLPIIQFFLSYSFKKMQMDYPNVFLKVAQNGEESFLIKPTDLPFNFYMVISQSGSGITVESKTSELTANATITASLADLLKMLEGKLDGDAAFFSKNLIIEGSTASVVKLRNAIDAENINIISSLTSNLGIFSKIIKRLLFYGINKVNNVNNFISELETELLKEPTSSLNYIFTELNNLKQELNKLINK